MTPEKTAWRRSELVALVTETVTPIIDGRLQALEEKQDKQHEENRDKLRDLLQLGQNQVALEKARSEEAEKYRKQREQDEKNARDEQERQQRLKNLRLKRLSIVLSIVIGIITLASALGLGNYWHRWITTGHLYPTPQSVHQDTH